MPKSGYRCDTGMHLFSGLILVWYLYDTDIDNWHNTGVCIDYRTVYVKN